MKSRERESRLVLPCTPKLSQGHGALRSAALGFGGDSRSVPTALPWGLRNPSHAADSWALGLFGEGGDLGSARLELSPVSFYEWRGRRNVFVLIVASE